MTTDTLSPVPQGRNRNVAVILFLLAAGMVGAAYAAVPIYQMFCQLTGYGGTPRIATDNPKGVIARDMTVRFDSNVDGGLAWKVSPSRPVTGAIGTVETIVYTAQNLSDKTVTGMAVFNVTPELAGSYFNKIECFCFTEQTLRPGQEVRMPVLFYVDKKFLDDPDDADVQEITLSYTFYPVEKPDDQS